MRAQRSASSVVRLLAASLVLYQLAAAQQDIHGYEHVAAQSPSSVQPIASTSFEQPNTPFHLASVGGALLERIGRVISAILPEPDGSSIGEADGGLFGGDGTTLAWGGSTLEVVKTQASYLTRPAAFGPRIIDEDGLRGSLLPISVFYEQKRQGSADEDAKPESYQDTLAIDNHGCPYRGGPGWRDDEESGGDRMPGENAADLLTTSLLSKPPHDWIALIERGGRCSFVAKVRVAQALGAKAVVVGDAPSPEHEHDGPLDNDPGLSGRLVTMFAPGDTSDVLIPSTFVTRPSYVDLIRLVEESTREDHQECVARKKEGKPCKEDKTGVQVILWRDDVMWEWPLIDLAFVLLMLPSFMTLVTIVVHRVRMIRQRRMERAPELAVLNLPCLIWRGNGQPWEKVEEAAVIGNAGKPTFSDDGNKPSRISVFLRRFRRRSQDMELGTTEDTPAVQQDGAGNEGNIAGPSTLHQPPVALKTTPVAPPVPPPDRTYYSCDECAICLSEFEDGEMVRVLPCGHVFHLPEIDSWLLRVKKLCPICKRDITVPVPPTPPAPSLQASGSPNNAEGTSQSAELLSTDSGQQHQDQQEETTPLLIHHDI